MTTTTSRTRVRLLRVRASAIALATGLFIAAALSHPTRAGHPGPVNAPSAKGGATLSKVRADTTPAVHTATGRASPAPEALSDDADALSFSDEYERAELVERMLAECRGIDYNAYELAQTSGESLWLPAPIQLFVVRVRHPYCAQLLRTYAPKQSV